MSENEPAFDRRFDYIKERIGAAFPKLSGPKFDKQISTDEIRLVLNKFVGVIRRPFQILYVSSYTHAYRHQRNRPAFLRR